MLFSWLEQSTAFPVHSRCLAGIGFLIGRHAFLPNCSSYFVCFVPLVSRLAGIPLHWIIYPSAGLGKWPRCWSMVVYSTTASGLWQSRILRALFLGSTPKKSPLTRKSDSTPSSLQGGSYASYGFVFRLVIRHSDLSARQRATS